MRRRGGGGRAVWTGGARSVSVTTNYAESVAISPASIDNLIAGNVTSLLVEVLTPDNEVLNPTVSYQSSDTNVATVDSSGNVTGVAAGTCTITATVGANVTSRPTPVSASIAVTVVTPTPTLQSIAVSPTGFTLEEGQTQQMAAIGTYSSGPPAVPPNLVWDMSAGGTKATVDSSTGLLTAVQDGAATVRATSGAVSGTASVTVVNPPGSGDPVPLFEELWSGYGDTAAALAAWNGNGAFGQLLGSYNNGHVGVWASENGGDSTGWREQVYSLVADNTFGKCIKGMQWGRDMHPSLAAIVTNQSCPTPRVTVQLGSVSTYWASRYIRFGKASDHPSGVRGWTVDNDGSSAYKILGDLYTNSFPGTGSTQHRAEVASLTKFLQINPNNGNASENPIGEPYRNEGAGYCFTLPQPVSATNNWDGWIQVVNCYIKTSSTRAVIGYFCRKHYYLDGTELAAPTATPTSYAQLQEGDWRGMCNEYIGSSVPNGMATFGWGLNMNGRIDYDQAMFYGPIKIYSGYDDPLGLLALFGVTL